MKDAQDAVKEIREWPKLEFEYLVEHEDGSIGFVDDVPPVVVCTREQFRAAKAMNNKVTNAVRCFKGVWPAQEITNGYLEEYLSSTVWTVSNPKPKSYICSRAEFEAEAKRMGYKSDRERWVEAALAQDCPPSQGMMSRTEFCEALYDALKSGELPMPEKD